MDRDRDRAGGDEVLDLDARLPRPAGPPARGEADEDEDEAKSGPEMMKILSARRVPEGGEVDPLKYIQAHKHAASMPQFSLVAGATLPASQPVSLGWSNIGLNDVGGRTRALVIHPTNPQTMWAGAASGGVWKSTNGGQTWTPETDTFDLDYINTLALDPTNPNVLYAGTGESSVPSYEGLRGLGILKTTDGGSTWTRLPSTMTSDFYWVNKVVVSNVNSQHVYASTSSGVWQSLDGGNTWKKSLAAPQAGSSPVVPGCQDMVIRSDVSTDYLFVGCMGGFYLPGGIWRNTDAAGSGQWTEVENLTTPVGIGLALAPSNQSIVYALIAGAGNNVGGTFVYNDALQSVLRSTSNGDAGSWTVQDSNTSPNLLNTLLLGYPSSSCGGPNADPQKIGYADYTLDIEVDPSNTNTVWVLGIDVFRSDDGGMNWGIAGFSDTFGVSYLHADQHKLVFAPGYNGGSNQTVYVVNDGGVYRSINSKAATVTGMNALCKNSNFSYNGETVVWTDLNSNYITTQFYHGTVAPGGTYMGGTQDQGTYRGNIAQPGLGAANIAGGDGGVSRFDPMDASTFYIEGAGSLARYTIGGGAITEIGDSFTNDYANYAPFKLDPQETRRLWWGGYFVWKTEDQGDTWKQMSPNTGNLASAIAVSPLDSNRVVAGNESGNIYFSTTALTSTPTSGWTMVKPRSGTVADLAFSPTDPNIVYAVYSTFNAAVGDNHVYKSVDSGRSWVGIDGGGVGIPDIPVSSILIDPQNPFVIYLGSDVGIFVSTDGGSTWAHDAGAFPQSIVNALALDRGAGGAYLYAYTFGRGIWRTPLGGSLAGTIAASAPCTYSVSPTNVNVDVAGTPNSVNVSTQPGCAWTAQVVKGYVELQPPASGVGSGTLNFAVLPNYYTSPRDPAALIVQGQTVTIGQQPAGTTVSSNDTPLTSVFIPSLPYEGSSIDNAYTSDASDPVHTCTGSADFQTEWWDFRANFTGYVYLSGGGFRADTAGSAGIVLTAYRSGNLTQAGELGCFTYPRTTSFPATAGGIVFPVQAGTTYFLELSTTTNTVNFNYLALASSSGPESFAISPTTVSLGAGGTQNFVTQVSNLGSSAARWSISPQTGSIDANGNYSAPPSLASPATVKVTAVSIADPARTATATISVNSAPVAISAVTNAASFLADAVSPGEMVTLFGNGLGPAALTGAQLNSSGNVASTVAQTQITFDGVPAPIIYVSAGQTTVMVPYEVAGKSSTKVVATYQGQSSAPLMVPVTDSVPALFAGADGKQGAILNYFSATPTVNTQQAPATAGTTIALFLTGEGLINPAPVDGQLNNGPTYPAPVLPVSVTIGGLPAQTSYAGEAPGGVAGFMQINTVVPGGLAPGAQPVVVKIGENISSGYVTVWVK